MHCSLSFACQWLRCSVPKAFRAFCSAGLIDGRRYVFPCSLHIINLIDNVQWVRRLSLGEHVPPTRNSGRACPAFNFSSCLVLGSCLPLFGRVLCPSNIPHRFLVRFFSPSIASPRPFSFGFRALPLYSHCLMVMHHRGCVCTIWSIRSRKVPKADLGSALSSALGPLGQT